MSDISIERTADLARDLGAFVVPPTPCYLPVAAAASEIPSYTDSPAFCLKGTVIALRRERRGWTLTVSVGGPLISEARVSTQAEVDAALREAYGAEGEKRSIA